jgi:hypothetical protein
MTRNYNKASLTEPSPPPLLTVVPPQVWVPWPISVLALVGHPTSDSSYPAATSSQPQRWLNTHSTSECRQTNTTSPPVSVSILFSAQVNFLMPTTSRFLTRRWSMSTMPTTPSSPSAEEPFYVVFVTQYQTSTEFCWLTWYGTTTPTPSLSIAPQPSTYPINPHPAKQSTMSAN